MSKLIEAKSKANFTGEREFFLRLRSKLAAAVERSQAIAVEEARNLVPVDTGELQASINATPIVDDGDTVTGLVEATAEHAAYVEFGTGARGAQSEGADHRHKYKLSWPGMAAQPYLRPALDTARSRIKKEFRR